MRTRPEPVGSSSGSRRRSARPEEVVAALRRSGSSAGDERVEVHETHISWVFLAGERAYKLKKPLVLPFLDYGTAGRRRRMCQEEVRLNRRLAPDLYLGVRGFLAGPGGLSLGDEDDPRAVDYVVEMRRYDAAATMASRLERGELRQPEVAAVARLLAEFHDRAPRVPPGPNPVLALEQRLTRDVHELLGGVEQRSEIGRVLDHERFVHAFIAAHAGRLERRARGGLRRELHGDLRAEHVLVGDPPQVVDCVEFDRGLRELDVAEDLAFLVMDLFARGGERYARALVDAYRVAGGDPGDERLIAFYAAGRAVVRAKVALLRAAQQPAASSARGRQSAAARDLLALAERFAWRARLPLVVAICGPPAAGKSALATALAGLAGLPYVSSDVTRKRLARVTPHERAGRDAYSDAFNRRTYAALGRRAAGYVRSCGGALIDATFRHRADRQAFAGPFGAAAPVLFVECRAPVRVLAERAARRERDPEAVSDASRAIVLQQSAVWDPLDEVAPEAHIILRSDRSVEAQIADVRALLDSRLAWLAAAAADARGAGLAGEAAWPAP